jgi:hypothetical protein
MAGPFGDRRSGLEIQDCVDSLYGQEAVDRLGDLSFADGAVAIDVAQSAAERFGKVCFVGEGETDVELHQHGVQVWHEAVVGCAGGRQQGNDIAVGAQDDVVRVAVRRGSLDGIGPDPPAAREQHHVEAVVRLTGPSERAEPQSGCRDAIELGDAHPRHAYLLHSI